MFIHVDGSANAGSDAWSEIDSGLLEDGRGAAQPPRRNASLAPSVGRLFSGRGTAARRQLGCANCANPCMHCRRNPSPSGSGICANRPTPFCLRVTGPYSGTKEFPVAAARAGALLFRIAGHSNRRRGSRNCGNPAAGDNGRRCHNNFTYYPRIGNLTFRWCAAKRTSHVPPLDPIQRRFPPSPAMAFAVGEGPGCAPGELVARARPGAGL